MSASVLLIDGLPETAEVLRAVLEPRGVQVARWRTAGAGDAADFGQPPRVVVVAEDAQESVVASHRIADVPRVVIGRTQAWDRSRSGVLSSPFDFAELIAAVDRALAEAA